MDFGGFIVFGLCCFGLIVACVRVGVLFAERSSARWRGLRSLIVGIMLLAGFGRYLYQVYWLDEGLYMAAASGDTAKVKVLLAAGADPSAAREDGTTALAAAEKGNCKDIVVLLKRAGGHD